MYICICHGVTDREIKACVADGACSMRELRACLGVGTQCGRCATEVRTILNETRFAGTPGLATDEGLAA